MHECGPYLPLPVVTSRSNLQYKEISVMSVSDSYSGWRHLRAEGTTSLAEMRSKYFKSGIIRAASAVVQD
jgi:hypothetical protein